MEESEIISQTLLKLDGWVLDDTELAATKYNKKISADEIIHFYGTAKDYACAYTQLNETQLMQLMSVDTALILWTAGLLWRKYNIRSNDNIDESVTIGYGDSLIIQAKEMLKPSKSYGFYAY